MDRCRLALLDYKYAQNAIKRAAVNLAIVCSLVQLMQLAYLEHPLHLHLIGREKKDSVQKYQHNLS